MTSALNQSIGDILDNYADVIEGGNTWRGAGDAYYGIPGTRPCDQGLFDGTDSTLTVVGTVVSSTTFDVANVSWDSNRWVSDAAPAFWALDAHGEARKITGWAAREGFKGTCTESGAPNAYQLYSATIPPAHGYAFNAAETDLVVGDRLYNNTDGGSSLVRTIWAMELAMVIDGDDDTCLWGEGDEYEKRSDSSVFTVGSAFTTAPVADDTMTMLQGFKRLPDEVPPDVDGTGWDRFFSLSMDRGERLEWFGNGLQTYKATLELRLRIIKHGRHHDAVASALENLAIIDAVLTRGANPDHRDGTYMRALISEGAPEIETEDQTKVVAVAKYGCIYRIGSEFL